ncbi:hypothetical protein V4C53_38140, partial [Paraburkholderia azotifigens]|uniref:hypothetical protein n=1 Tax=Paraburkholderia azotifigens TaxID=2057004 RepID=UPI00317CA7CC
FATMRIETKGRSIVQQAAAQILDSTVHLGCEVTICAWRGRLIGNAALNCCLSTMLPSILQYGAMSL